MSPETYCFISKLLDSEMHLLRIDLEDITKSVNIDHFAIEDIKRQFKVISNAYAELFNSIDFLHTPTKKSVVETVDSIIDMEDSNNTSVKKQGIKRATPAKPTTNNDW